MNFDATQQAFLNYLQENKLWRNFLPVAELLLIIGGILPIVGNFISLGIFGPIILMLWYIGLVLTIGKGNYKVVALGISLRVVDYILSGLLPIFNRSPRIGWTQLLWAVFYALFALAAFKKSGMTVNDVKANMNVQGMKNAMNLNEARNFNFNNARRDASEAYRNTANTVQDIKSQMARSNPNMNPNQYPNQNPNMYNNMNNNMGMNNNMNMNPNMQGGMNNRPNPNMNRNSYPNVQNQNVQNHNMPNQNIQNQNPNMYRPNPNTMNIQPLEPSAPLPEVESNFDSEEGISI